jgi:hypothetical protein
MTLRHQLAALDRPAKGGHGEDRRASYDVVRNAELRQPDGRFEIKRRILVSARREAGAALEHLADDELVFSHARRLRYSLACVNGRRRTSPYAAQG